ncbi:hypothetical protein ABPG75_000999 [Micractinium tetrahymenae]
MLQRVALHSSAGAGRPVFAAQRVSTAPQRQRRTLRVSASAAHASTGSGAPSAEALAAQVAEKERQLAAMFEPGKLQPRASQVAALRKEIADLRSQLQAQLGGGSKAGLSPAAGAASRAAAAQPSAAAPVSVSTSSAVAAVAPTAAQKRLLDALRLAEAQMAASRDGGSSPLSLEEQQEVLRLQDENASLKTKLDVVLARQVQLQQLCDQHGIPPRAAAANGAASSNGALSNGAAAFMPASSAVPQPAPVAA